LSDEIDNLSDRIEEVNETIETASEQQERVEGLRKRKELQSELDDLRSEHDELSSQIEAGFPGKRREIRERHALTVRIRPVAATAISYERGDLELTLQSNSRALSRTYGYAVGVGVMEDADCEQCGEPLTAENPLTITGSRTIGASCCGE
jgi:predicted RNase H-like nuclease (RuvC/YqgF family)